MVEKTKRKNEEGTGEASRKRLLRAVALSERLLVKRLERALLHEEEIDALLETVDAAAREEGMSEKARRDLLAAAGAIRCEDLSKLVGIIGVLSDKERELCGRDGADTGGGERSTVHFEEM